SCSVAPLDRHSFPTRRSSDLNAEQQRRFFTIYKSKFEPSRRKEDPVLTRESFFEQVFPDDQIDELRALPLDKLSGADGKPIGALDRKSTRLNSSHVKISYAVF